MVRLSMHFIFFALILFGFYYVTVYPPLVSMEVFALGQIHTFTGQEVYLMLVGNLLVMYLFVMLLNFTGSISLWASRYTKAHKNNMADRLIRQAIESWVEGKPERAGRKFTKASDILRMIPFESCVQLSYWRAAINYSSGCKSTWVAEQESH